VPGNKTGQASHWGGGCNHSWWKELEKQGVSTGRYFVEPVILTINYAKKVLGYKRIIMMGLSGGGWTTTMAAALDPRIELSIPVAGSIPCSFDHTSIDFEQFCERPYNQVCDYECQYVLASLEASRYSVQIIHEFVSFASRCLVSSAGLHYLFVYSRAGPMLLSWARAPRESQGIQCFCADASERPLRDLHNDGTYPRVQSTRQDRRCDID
jgi:pimeloyl-ACP methyl ester carboxylesterase